MPSWFALFEDVFLAPIEITSRTFTHLPCDKVEYADHLSLAYFHDGEPAASHEQTDVVASESREFDEILAIEERLAEHFAEPLGFRRDDFFDFDVVQVSFSPMSKKPSFPCPVRTVSVLRQVKQAVLL